MIGFIWALIWITIGILFFTVDKYSRYVVATIAVMFFTYMLLTTM